MSVVPVLLLVALVVIAVRVRRARKARSAVAPAAPSSLVVHASISDTGTPRAPRVRWSGSRGSM